MNDRPDIHKKLSNLANKKKVFTPNLGYKRIAAKDSESNANVEVKVENDGNMQSSTQKQKKVKERSTTQIQSVFSNMSSNSHSRSGSSHSGLTAGFRSYSNHGDFNSKGTFVKAESNQCIQQMQLIQNDRFDVDDPLENNHGPIRFPFVKKEKKTSVIKTENSLEYPFQETVYPSLSELVVPESLSLLQFYDSSFSVRPKVVNIDLTGNTTNNLENSVKNEAAIIPESNGLIKEENMDMEYSSRPIGKVQFYRSGRVILNLNGKIYELMKANEERHHKELFSLTKEVETNKPEKLVSLGTLPLRLKAVMDINNIIDNFSINEI
ncbi:uncharacterized protein LOC126903631 [Daktulosphaira vitifoliae]|uniref:uncharacterized protein LOC126903631 n=1 Tax=Daktulosphaira vitifoliae TaxID=58002 RepID=UPI0021AAF449|nr:uncharacterized protein LOC126903631 [Daktulosphaira vitifoliae]